MEALLSNFTKLSSLLFDRLFAAKDGVTILIYHRIGTNDRSSVTIGVEDFENQIAVIAESGRAITLNQALSRLEAGDSTPGVVVTFDDGTSDFTDIAVPIMVRHRVASLLYAETAPITSGTASSSGCPPTSWAALRDAASTGLVEIGSHTHTHRLLHNADEATVIDELDRSITTIAENMGSAPAHFAYPKAVRGNAIAEAHVKSRFRSAVLGQGGSNRPGQNLYRLARTSIKRRDSPEVFSSKLAGGMRFEGITRSALGRWRYRNHEN
jgi:hypothetical protein